MHKQNTNSAINMPAETFVLISTKPWADPWQAIQKQAGKLALANASENLARRVENRPGWVEFSIGYIRD